MGAKLAWIAADRLYRQLEAEPCQVTWAALGTALTEIESRFADHLQFVKLFIIPEERALLFGGADELLKTGTANLYPAVWFDCEEAAKCLCLGRSTASVFHSMRMIEVAIAAISRRLGIPSSPRVGHAQDQVGVRICELRNLHHAGDRLGVLKIELGRGMMGGRHPAAEEEERRRSFENESFIDPANNHYRLAPPPLPSGRFRERSSDNSPGAERLVTCVPYSAIVSLCRRRA